MPDPHAEAVSVFARDVEQRFRRAGTRQVLYVVDPNGDDEAWTGNELLDLRAEFASRLAAVAPGPVNIVSQLGNSAEAVALLLACWTRGDNVLPLSPDYTQQYVADRVAQQLAPPALLVRSPEAGEGGLAHVEVHGFYQSPGYTLPTGGSEGNPRLVPLPGRFLSQSLAGLRAIVARAQWREGQRQAVLGPLDHAASFRFLLLGLLDSQTLSLFRSFSASRALAEISERAVSWFHVTPAQMLAMTSDERFTSNWHQSVEGMLHTSARCPQRLKRTWIEAIGAQKVHELYSFTEMVGATYIDGAQWLDHPGSVGRGYGTEIRVLDDEGRAVPAGTLGRVFLRSALSRHMRPQLLQSGVTVLASGFCWVGDYGWLDESGYLTIAGIRESDVVQLPDGVLYPGLIEDAALTVQAARDVAVTVTSTTTGHRVVLHVQPDPGADADHVVREVVAATERLLPSTMRANEIRLAQIPRTSKGKLDRSLLLSLSQTEGNP